MKTLIVLLSLFVTQMSFANSVDIICRSKHMGYDQRQISVLLTKGTPYFDATVYVTHTNGVSRPLFFKNLQPYGINGAVTYVSRGTTNQMHFFLTIRSGHQGTLELGSNKYNVACVSARDPIPTM